MRYQLQIFRTALSLLIAFVLSVSVIAQTAELKYDVRPYKLESGVYDGAGDVGTQPGLAYSAIISVPDIPWIQLHFEKSHLGENSYITIRSFHDDYWQKLNTESIQQWNYFSAFFNGGTVELKLYVDAQDRGVFINLDEVIVGVWEDGDDPESICGSTDDRQLSNQPATGRLLNVGCTGWIIPNGKIVSAGHCISSAGSVNVMQFNVPLSLPNGTLQHPPPEHQYSADVTTRVFSNSGVGNDWGVFEVFPNSVTGLMPKQAQNAFYVLKQDLGPVSIRITGYGTTSPANERNQAQQTHVGPNAGSSGTTMRYRTDTTGGNSGSPIVDEATGMSVGVHSHGGCTSTGGNNNGTSFFRTEFWTAVEQGAGGCPVDPASSPNPAHASTGISINLTQLSWTNGTGAVATELYFGTNPSALTLVQSGSLSTSWNITGGPLSYGTTYYWRVNSIGDTCTTNGSMWSFTTEQDPMLVQWVEPFNNLSNWTILGPLGLTNWTANNSANAGGTAPELRMSWTPSFNGVSRIRSNVITFSPPLPNNQEVSYSFRFSLDWYANPSGTVEVLITWNGGTTTTPLYTLVNPTGDVGPLTVSGTFMSPASETLNLQAEIVFTGNSFNIDFIYWDNLTFGYIIPVELASFAALTNNNDVVLNWSTSSELNNQGFEVERSLKGQDWQKIGYVAGHGTTSESMSYSFTDYNLNNGAYSYRLKQIDFDGSFVYSNVIEVEVNAPVAYSLEQNYPNPFNPATTIAFGLASDSKVTLKIFDVLGQEAATIANDNFSAGQHKVDFDAAGLNSGVYFYSIDAAGVDGSKFIQTRKMILIK